ncbi:hypothetical protein MJ561_04990 [Klebsiella pneumoniae]|nr:hypothetical protein MJ561_04990 [Klebsiella pneumoniae]
MTINADHAKATTRTTPFFTGNVDINQGIVACADEEAASAAGRGPGQPVRTVDALGNALRR